MEMVEVEDWKLKRLEDRDRSFTRLEKELREKGIAYDSCSGCGWAYSHQPEIVLEAVNGRDCGCPAGSGFAVRKVSRKRTPQEIEAWAAEAAREVEEFHLLNGDNQHDAEEAHARERRAGYLAAMADLEAFLGTRHAKTYKCNTCHDEKVLHDTPTIGVETPCPDCTREAESGQ
jgi:hypothetical protein